MTDEGRVGNTNFIDRYDEMVDHLRLIVNQYADYSLIHGLAESFEPGLNKKTVPELIAWFQSFMVFDKSSELRRFNWLPTIWNQKKGRCGEWAILFTAILIALKKQARLVFSFEDHVWTEVWSKSQRRWIHVDSTLGPNANYDRPYTYQDSFHHKMIKVITVAPHGKVEDITLNYTRSCA